MSLNAKKLDINFDDGDDFFDSFGGPDNALAVPKPTGGIKETKTDVNPFEMATHETSSQSEFHIGESNATDRTAFVSQ